MATPYMKQKPKTRAYKGQCTFSDFSEGLYLLDTPRGLQEQLGSLAMTGGRNVYTEKGALVPQNGYDIVGEMPEGTKVIGVTRDSASYSSLYILTMLGQIYYYSPTSGLKEFKTAYDSLLNSTIYTRVNDNLVTYYQGEANIFGNYYEDSDYVEITNTATCLSYGTWAQLNIDKAQEKYFWKNKKIAFKGYGGGIVTDVQSSKKEYINDLELSNLTKDKDWHIRGTVSVNETDDSANQEVVIDTASGFKITPNTTSEVVTTGGTKTTKVVSKACYKYNATGEFSTMIDRSNPIPNRGNKKIAKSGYVYAENDPAKLKSFMYVYNQGDKASSESQLTGKKFIWEAFESGVVVLSMDMYPCITSINGTVATGACIHNDMQHTNANNMTMTLVRDKTGDFYTTKTESTSTETTVYHHKVTFTIPFSDGTTETFETGDIPSGQFTWEVIHEAATNIYTVILKTGLTELYTNSVVKDAELKCVADNPEGSLTNGNTILIDIEGNKVNVTLEESILVTVVPYDENANFEEIPTEGVSVGEQTLLPITLKYVPEEESEASVELVPAQMGSASNRLIITTLDGTIYYSAVGILDNFNESAGAGYFKGFYGDSSTVLGFEDFLNGILIIKQNGMYLATVSNTTKSNSVSSDSTSGLSIEKISSVGQEFFEDHVIVEKAIYAYDSNARAFVCACSQNAFGTLSSTQTLIPSEYFDTLNLTISDSTRCLVFDKTTRNFILYYGTEMSDGIVITPTGGLFPRKMDKVVDFFRDCAQTIIGITTTNKVIQDFKKNTIIPDIEPVVEFEPIGLLGNKMTCASLLEISELNGIKYSLSCSNISTSYQHITPYTNYGIDGVELPPLLYSNDKYTYELFGVLPEEEDETLKEILMQKQVTKWARKKSNCTRVYAPMSGREGISLTLEFQPNVAFCLAAINIVDWSQGE